MFELENGKLIMDDATLESVVPLAVTIGLNLVVAFIIKVFAIFGFPGFSALATGSAPKALLACFGGFVNKNVDRRYFSAKQMLYYGVLLFFSLMITLFLMLHGVIVTSVVSNAGKLPLLAPPSVKELQDIGDTLLFNCTLDSIDITNFRGYPVECFEQEYERAKAITEPQFARYTLSFGGPPVPLRSTYVGCDERISDCLSTPSRNALIGSTFKTMSTVLETGFLVDRNMKPQFRHGHAVVRDSGDTWEKFYESILYEPGYGRITIEPEVNSILVGSHVSSVYVVDGWENFVRDQEFCIVPLDINNKIFEGHTLRTHGITMLKTTGVTAEGIVTFGSKVENCTDTPSSPFIRFVNGMITEVEGEWDYIKFRSMSYVEGHAQSAEIRGDVYNQVQMTATPVETAEYWRHGTGGYARYYSILSFGVIVGVLIVLLILTLLPTLDILHLVSQGQPALCHTYRYLSVMQRYNCDVSKDHLQLTSYKRPIFTFGMLNRKLYGGEEA